MMAPEPESKYRSNMIVGHKQPPVVARALPGTNEAKASAQAAANGTRNRERTCMVRGPPQRMGAALHDNRALRKHFYGRRGAGVSLLRGLRQPGRPSALPVSATHPGGSMPSAIEPFRIAADDAQLEDLRRRLRATRWPERETVDDWSQGIPLAYVQDVCAYWADKYDWRARETRLNRFAQFRTEVDGLGIHFVHVRSPHAEALPLVITHGWPGSIVEFQKVIDPLVNPTAHGGDARDAFHVVCPSLPGYGFSDKPAKSGWTTQRIAKAWAQLMARLGYARYVAQGGDWGAMVTTWIGTLDPEHCAAIHLNMPIAPPDPATMSELSEKEQSALAGMQHYQEWDSGYSKQQSTRPQTVGYG